MLMLCIVSATSFVAGVIWGFTLSHVGGQLRAAIRRSEDIVLYRV